MKQLYLQQGHTWKPDAQLNNWYVSEKYDGQRAFWDGGESRGKPVSAIHYANTTKDRHTNYRATGLWSRYGKVIHAAPPFLDQLPNGIALDIEIWGGYDKFQMTTGIVRSQASPLWYALTAIAFDAPPMMNFLNPRHIDIPQADFWVNQHGSSCYQDYTPFRDRLRVLQTLTPSANFRVAEYQDASHADALMDEVLERGGEGLIYRSPLDVWLPQRCHTVLKRKPSYTGVGEVVGRTDGRGKYEGMVGALIIKSRKHGEFQLSGMTDAQRKPDVIPFGQTVEYTYDTLTVAGFPRNARLRCLK
jgi:DNA ligase 1